MSPIAQKTVDSAEALAPHANAGIFLSAPNGKEHVEVAAPPATPSRSHVLHRDLGHDPLLAVSARGCYIHTSDGRRVLDACGGAAVMSVGHCEPRVVEALADQMRTVGYCHSGLWSNAPSEQLAALLCGQTGMERCLFANGGSEAVETAVKLARQHFLEAGQPRRVNFIAREQSYHGNLLGSLSLSGHKARRGPYEPLLSQRFHHVSPCYPFRHKRRDADADNRIIESDDEYVQRLSAELEAKFEQLGPETVAAFVCETVGGATSGCLVPVPGYLPAIRQVCDKYGALLILDEVMCGMGRTGYMHSWEAFGVKPDIQVVAKGLTGGYAPCSAVLASARVVEPLRLGSGRFTNGFTFQSWSVGARAALAVQDVLREDGLVERCGRMGALLGKRLRDALSGSDVVGDIRGMGLFWAVEFVRHRPDHLSPFAPQVRFGERVADACLALGDVVVYPGAGTVDGVVGDHVLLAPPFTIDEAQVDDVVEALRKGVEFVASEVRAQEEEEARRGESRAAL